jgi:predicted DNA binding CopG/RHH family protein
LLFFDDLKHSVTEKRFVAHGGTAAGRLLTAAFTICGKRIRVISVRDMSVRSGEPMPKRVKKLKPIPQFRSDEDAGEFWMTHDTTEYLDWSKVRRVRFANLRPSTATISLRLPQRLLGELRTLANERDVPYQSLLKVYLAERVAKEGTRRRTRRRRHASA